MLAKYRPRFAAGAAAGPGGKSAATISGSFADSCRDFEGVGYRMLTLALVLGVVLAGGQGSAFAAVAALERVAEVSAFTSVNKSVTTTCPAGKPLLGTGSAVDGFGQVGVVDQIPNAALTGMSVRAVEDGDGFANGWALAGYALCASPVPGLVRIAAASPANSANKGVSAACPAGKRLLGTGFAITDGGGQVVLRELIPNSALTSVSAFGAEDENGFGGNWSMTAYAVCANPVGGLQRMVATSSSNSDDGKSVTVACPAGKRVTGVGGRLTGSSGEVFMDDLLPTGPFPVPTSVFVAGIEDQNGFAGNWSATAYAICVNSSVRVVATSPNDSASNKNVTAFCPGDKAPTGAGADINGGVGEVVLEDLVPHGSPPGTGVEGVEDQTGTARNWFLRAHAICSTPLPGLERIVAFSPGDSGSFKQVSASCPAGKKVVGAGGAHSGGGQVVMDRIVPNAALTSVTVRAQEDEDFTSADWSVAAIALCANPPPGLQLTGVSSALASDDIKSVTSSCPAGKNLLGTGGELSGGMGQAVIDDLRPDALLTNVTVTGIEDETGFDSDWTATAYAICANV